MPASGSGTRVSGVEEAADEGVRPFRQLELRDVPAVVEQLELGMRHGAESLDAPDHFVTVLDEPELPEGAMKRVDAKGIPVLLYRDANGVRAIGAICTHRGAPLDQGKMKDGCIECPWHGSVFDFDGGGVVKGPATFPVTAYETRIKDGKIAIRPKA